MERFEKERVRDFSIRYKMRMPTPEAEVEIRSTLAQAVEFAESLRRFVLKSEHRSFDSLETGYRLSDYSFEVLRATYHDKAFEESDFESVGLATERGVLTNAGALFADNSLIRHSRVFCTRWNGLDKTSGVMEALDDKDT